MANLKTSMVSFNAGVLSPKLDARVDLSKYANGCRVLKNAMVGLYGEAERRPGFEYIAATKDHTTKTRVVDFQVSAATTFVLEFGHLYLRFYSDGAPIPPASWKFSTAYVVGNFVTSPINGLPYRCAVAHTSGAVPTDFTAHLALGDWVLDYTFIYEIATPYSNADVFELHFAQSNDVAYITHPDYPVQKLSRLGEANWTLAAAIFDSPALLDDNITTTTITPSATTGAVNLVASAPIFTAGHVGSYWQVAHLRESSFVEVSITANGTSSTIPILGRWNVRTYGIWVADISIERSRDGGTTWETVRVFAGKEDRNVDNEGEEDEEALYRVDIANYAAPGTPGTTTPRVVIEAVDAYIYGVVKVTAVADSTHASGTVVDDLAATTATKVWAEAAWSRERGYPRAVTIFEQSVYYAGTYHQPQTFWKSVTGDYENFKYGTKDTDAVAYTIGSKRQQSIQWLVAQKALLIGTSAGEWAAYGGTDGDAPLSPSNITVKSQSEHGSSEIEGKLINDVVLFVQRNGRKVRELAYSLERDKYVAPDLTLLAENVTVGKIVQIATQQLPITRLWAVTGSGKLISMTYEREQEVVGWHVHETDGLFESVCVVYGAEDDEIWCVVKRTIGGVTKRYVERMHARFDPDSGDTLQDAFFVDCGLSYDGAPAATFSGLGHLEGKTVQILADGAVMPSKVVTGGAVSLPADETASVVHIGLPFETQIQPMRLDTDPQAGNMQGMTKRIAEVWLRLMNTVGCTVGDGVNFEDEIPFRNYADNVGEPPKLFTGDKQVEWDGDFEPDTKIIITQTDPLPFQLLGLIVKYILSKT